MERYNIVIPHLVDEEHYVSWDNKEDFRHLETYPHHHHDDQGNVKPSPLTGDPVRDIELVLHEISTFLAFKEGD